MFILLFMSCKKDETKVVASNGTVPSLTATQTTLLLSQENPTATATVLSWTASSFNYQAGVSYSVEIDSVAGNFKKEPKTIVVATELTKTFTVAEINTYANQLGLKSGVAGKLLVRVVASIGAEKLSATSSVITLNVTPFGLEIFYPSIYLTGNYNAGAEVARISSKSMTDVVNYEGYVNLTTTANEFKFTSTPNLQNDVYGMLTAGTLVLGGGSNILAPAAGYYLIKANTKALTYSVTKTVWAAIGSATGSWDSETPMTYDAVNKVWTLTKVLSVGEMKFRANGDYAINFGDAEGDGIPEYNGPNIAVKSAGNYKISLNLNIPGNYTYTLTKQ